MCIVCEIKADLSKSKASAEETQAILSKVEKLARAMGDVIDVVEAVHKRTPEAFNGEELAKVAEAEELFVAERDGLAGGLGALLMAALLGGIKVETIAVELQPGETPEQAVARTMAEREAKSSDVTKH